MSALWAEPETPDWVWRRRQGVIGPAVWELVERNSHMRLPDNVPTCVVFLGCKISGKLVRGGTAFLVRGDDVDGWGAVVTAKHCIDEVRKRSDDGNVVLWLNRREPGPLGDMVEFWESHVDKWVSHLTKTSVDVAVLPAHPPLAQFDQFAIGVSMFASDAVVDRFKIGIGDDLVIPGLFVKHAGKTRNVPIIRMGHVAAMDAEPVNTGLGMARGYLAEVRSIGGLSGSPVLFRNHMFRVVYEHEDIPEYSEGAWFLLGLMHGHFDIDVPEELFDYGVSREVVNTGIGIVVPAQDILDVLLQPKLENMRKTEKAAKDQATADFVAPDEFGEFTTLTDKLLHVPKSEVDELRQKDQ